MEFHNLSEHSEELTRAVPFCTLSFKTHTVSQQSKPVYQIRVALKVNSYITDCTKEWKISKEIRHESKKKKNPHNTFLLYIFLYFGSLIFPSGPLASLSVSLTGFSELALFSLWQRWCVQPEIQLLIWELDFRCDFPVFSKLGQVWG